MLKIPSNTTILDILLPESRATPLSYLPTKKSFQELHSTKKNHFLVFLLCYINENNETNKGCLEFCFLLYFSSYYLLCITEFL